jgi:hypothetical protein
MSWWVRAIVVGVLSLVGAVLVEESRAGEWITADKTVVKIDACREVIESADPGLHCYAEDGLGIAGADQEDLGHRIQVVQVQHPPGAPGHPSFAAYTWSDWQALRLAFGAGLIAVALVTLVWPAVGALLRRRRIVSA